MTRFAGSRAGRRPALPWRRFSNSFPVGSGRRASCQRRPRQFFPPHVLEDPVDDIRVRHVADHPQPPAAVRTDRDKGLVSISPHRSRPATRRHRYRSCRLEPLRQGERVNVRVHFGQCAAYSPNRFLRKLGELCARTPRLRTPSPGNHNEPLFALDVVRTRGGSRAFTGLVNLCGCPCPLPLTFRPEGS